MWFYDVYGGMKNKIILTEIPEKMVKRTKEI